MCSYKLISENVSRLNENIDACQREDRNIGIIYNCC